MAKTYITASLLPLIDDSQPFYLELDESALKIGSQEDSMSPFLVLNDDDPMFRLIGAKILTPAKSKIQSVCLMMQKDLIQASHDGFQSLQNEAVVEAWQSVFDFYALMHQPPKPILHKEHISDSGRLLPMASLFYCKLQNRFFHPLCPTCLQQLQLCIDDDLLQKNDLQRYATSLKRYLYCPTCCHQNENLSFYVPSKDGGQRELVKDLSQLLAGYGHIVDTKDEVKVNIPCSDCNELTDCYRSKDLVGSRIIPFSFYPFFMLMFPAVTLNARDFLMLISGASVISLKDRYAADPDPGKKQYFSSVIERFGSRPILFMDKDDELFLEILYLKLSFLYNLIESCFPNFIPDEYPDLELSLSRVWIKVVDPDGFHPLMWNFKVSFLGVGPCTTGMPEIPNQITSRPLYDIGTIWFYTLLVNQSQDADTVTRGMSQLLEDLSGEHINSGNLDLIRTGFLNLTPENIFWNPEKRSVNQTLAPFWDQSLELGMSLLKGSLTLDSNGSMHAFYISLEKLRSDVKERLFQNRPSPPSSSPNMASVDKNPQSILMHILKKWREAFTAGVESNKPRPKPIPTQDAPQIHTIDDQEEAADIYETVIISADRFQSTAHVDERRNNNKSSPASIANGSSALDGFENRSNDESIESQETVIIPTNGSNINSSNADALDEGLPKTIIISKTDASAKSSPFDRQIMSKYDETNNKKQSADRVRDTTKLVDNDKTDDELEKTIIQKPSKKD